MFYLSDFSTSTFSRGPDKKPRKKKLKNLHSITNNAFWKSLTYGGALATGAALFPKLKSSTLRNITAAGLVGGAGLGTYQGIKAVKKKKPIQPYY